MMAFILQIIHAPFTLNSPFFQKTTVPANDLHHPSKLKNTKPITLGFMVCIYSSIFDYFFINFNHLFEKYLSSKLCVKYLSKSEMSQIQQKPSQRKRKLSYKK